MGGISPSEPSDRQKMGENRIGKPDSRTGGPENNRQKTVRDRQKARTLRGDGAVL
jgi:hypothetical protein